MKKIIILLGFILILGSGCVSQFNELEDVVDQDYTDDANKVVTICSTGTGICYQAITDLNTSLSGLYLLKNGDHATGLIIFDGNASFPDNNASVYGTGGDALIYYNGTNLVIDPNKVGTGYVDINGGNVAVQNIGIGNAPPSNQFILFAGLGTESTSRGILVGQLVYVGTLAPTALNFGIDYNGNVTAITAQGSNLFARAQRNASGTSTLDGGVFTTGLTPLKNIKFTGGTWTFDGVEIRISGTDSNTFVTGGNWLVRGLYQQEIGDFNNFAIAFGALFNNDVQLNSGTLLIFDGPNDTSKGNTDINYNVGTSDLNFRVDGNAVATFDNDFTDWWTPNNFNQDVNAKKNLYGQYMNISTDNATSCITGCDAFDGNGGNWSCISATTYAAINTTCGDATVQKNCQCKN